MKILQKLLAEGKEAESLSLWRGEVRGPSTIRISEVIESVRSVLSLRPMQVQEGRDKFIQAWGTLGSSWGINRTMAQIHALLLVSHVAMSTEEIMEALGISRGNVNMNVRSLMDWGIVHKELRPGDRKEYFLAEKDIYTTAMKIMRQRRKRELEPLIDIMSQLKQVKADDTKEGIAFTKTVHDIDHFAHQADTVLNAMEKMSSNWFTQQFLTLLKKIKPI
ncbi:hypothetical protein BH09BAC1_BH09BAC1_06410 [soil metagenome]